MNVIIIVSDTLRRDHLPCYGNQEVIAPNLDAFSKRALVFEDCYPSSFPTVPARADMMTGRYTFTYQSWGPLAQTETTLAGLLSQAGYATAAIADTPFLGRRGYGYERGFHEFIYVRGQLHGTERDYLHMQRHVSEIEGYCAPKTFKEAADWLERHHDKPFFLYVDTWDPHEPWDPPQYYVKPYLADYGGEVVNPTYWDYKEDGLTERDLEIARACYKGEISMVDHWFGYLMERVRVLNLLEDTCIIFISDHGFYFGEHGVFGKRRFRWSDNASFDEGFAKGRTMAEQTVHWSPLHNEVTQVPLMMYMPGEDSRRITGLVTWPDMMPTILDVVDVEVPDRVQAKSVLPLIRGETSKIHDIVVTTAPFEELGQLSKTVDDKKRTVKEVSPSTITDGEWDLLYSVEGQRIELYRTHEDCEHQQNVADQHPEVVQRLHAQFVDLLKAADTPEGHLNPRLQL